MTNYSSARDQYLESEVLSAGPVRRIQLLYEGALEGIARARLALAAGDIPTRAAKVNKALDILTELALSLDHDRGASVTRELLEIYDYAQRCLIEGSSQQSDKPFADAEHVLKTVLEAWKAVPEVETHSLPISAAAGYVPVDSGAGDTYRVGSISSRLDQLG